MEYMTALQHGLDDHKPSLFELLSEQQLSALIPPSLRYLLVLATHRRPRYLLRVLNSFDELYALLALLVERHYLITHGGSFTESFYGLKRERVLRVKGREPTRARFGAPNLMRETLKLNSKAVWANLAIMVGLPYVKRKLDESFDIHAPSATILGPSYNRDTLPQDATIRQKIIYYYKWFLRNVYPSINAAYYFSILAFSLGYLFDNTKYSSPFLWLIGVRIRRMAEADHRAIALAEQPSLSAAPRSGSRPGQGNSIFNPATMTGVVYPRLLSSLKMLLPTSIFALKFLEWWHASDFARQLSRKAAEDLELPPPIISGLSERKTSKPASASKAKPRSSSSLQPVTNTVSLSSSAQSSPSPPTSATSSQAASPSKSPPPISSLSRLPILTVPLPTPSTSPYCPICLSTIQNPTAAQTGYVFCYTCIFKWVDGSHPRQERYMEGAGGEEGWGESGDDESDDEDGNNKKRDDGGRSRVGKWEGGKGRCAVTGRRLLSGTEGLRRVMV